MKKRKNKQRNQLLKLLPKLRSIIKDLSLYYPTPMSALMSPGLVSVFENKNDSKAYVKTLSYSDRVIETLNPLKSKYYKFDLLKLYRRIWKEDFYNFCVHNYKFDPRGREYIGKNGNKIIRI